MSTRARLGALISLTKTLVDISGGKPKATMYIVTAGNTTTQIYNNNKRFVYRIDSIKVAMDTDATVTNRRVTYVRRDSDDNQVDNRRPNGAWAESTSNIAMLYPLSGS